jgi:hypothetical protein
MRRAIVERFAAIVLFVLVLVVFSFAERDTKKLVQFYNSKNSALTPVKSPEFTAATMELPAPVRPRISRN